jgi:hypothetical protein
MQKLKNYFNPSTKDVDGSIIIKLLKPKHNLTISAMDSACLRCYIYHQELCERKGTKPIDEDKFIQLWTSGVIVGNQTEQLKMLKNLQWGQAFNSMLLFVVTWILLK